MNIGLLGTPVTSGNRGVQALATSLINLCFENSKDITVRLFLNTRDKAPAHFSVNNSPKQIPVTNCRLSPRSSLNDHLFCIVLASLLYRFLKHDSTRRFLRTKFPWIDALSKTEIVGDIRGGDSFTDIYGMQRYILGFLISWTVILIKGSIIQFPQTLGPYRYRLSKVLAKYLLNKSSIIYARDKASVLQVNDLLGKNRKTFLCPDVAFTLPALKPSAAIPGSAQVSDVLPSSFRIGININALVFNGGYNRNNMFDMLIDYPRLLLDIIKYLHSGSHSEILLFPHTFSSPGDVEHDPDACHKLHDLIPAETRERVHIVDGEYDCCEIKWLIGQCHFFIGSRMHSCIAALSQAIPCVGIAYSRKFIGVFETISMADWVIDGTKETNDQALQHFRRLYSMRQTITSHLSQTSHDICETVTDTFSKLFAAHSN